MFFFADAGAIKLGIGIAVFIIFIFVILDTKGHNAAGKAIPVKATVVKVMPSQNGKAQVIFETTYGSRVNLEVPNCTLLEGEVGMLKYNGLYYSSFTKETNTSASTESTPKKQAETISNRPVISGGWKCSKCGRENYDYVMTCSCGHSRLDG